MAYVLPQYEVWEQKDIVYGTAVNFAGVEEELLLDLYKPAGDNNCRRPLIVMIHGGAWIAGSKNDYDMAAICREMASRGYVAASIEYRLGMHPDDYYVPYAFCNDNVNLAGLNKCIYIADTLEVIRALYRGTQDAKGAIRFLKNRHETDSTDVENVFVGGSSAGAFISLYVGLMDLPSERPGFTFEMDDAPMPDADLLSCVPANANRSRPDMGNIEGDLNTGGYNANVQGVAAFMGGVFQPNLAEGPDTPAIYLYHRTDDLVVPCGQAPLLQIFPSCYEIVCQPHYNRPRTYGSCAIVSYLESMGNTAPPFFNDILEYGPPGNCFSPNHSIENIPLRCANMAGLFAPLIAASGNTPSSECIVDVSLQQRPSTEIYIRPNPPVGRILQLSGPGLEAGGKISLQLLDVTGKIIGQNTAAAMPFHWDLSAQAIPAGLYFVRMEQQGQVWVEKIVLK